MVTITLSEKNGDHSTVDDKAWVALEKSRATGKV